MNLILPLRIVQTILSIIVLGLAGYCVEFVGGNYSEASFLVFVCIWTWLVLLYMVLTPLYFPGFHNRWVVVGLESVTMIFWFAGFVAIADSTKASRFVCFGSGCRALECAKAAAVFGAFSWLAWLATMGLIIDALLKYRKGKHAVDPNAALQKQQQNREPAGSQPPIYGHPPPPRSGIPTPEPADFGGVE